MTNKYNFLKSQTNPNMYKSHIKTTNFYKKIVIKQVNTQKKTIYTT
jgi:hypothetical protein